MSEELLLGAKLEPPPAEKEFHSLKPSEAAYPGEGQEKQAASSLEMRAFLLQDNLVLCATRSRDLKSNNKS